MEGGKNASYESRWSIYLTFPWWQTRLKMVSRSSRFENAPTSLQCCSILQKNYLSFTTQDITSIFICAAVTKQQCGRLSINIAFYFNQNVILEYRLKILFLIDILNDISIFIGNNYKSLIDVPLKKKWKNMMNLFHAAHKTMARYRNANRCLFPRLLKTDRNSMWIKWNALHRELHLWHYCCNTNIIGYTNTRAVICRNCNNVRCYALRKMAFPPEDGKFYGCGMTKM